MSDWAVPASSAPRCTDWQVASQALDELMGKLLVVRRLLEAEERLPKREPQGSRRNS